MEETHFEIIWSTPIPPHTPSIKFNAMDQKWIKISIEHKLLVHSSNRIKPVWLIDRLVWLLNSKTNGIQIQKNGKNIYSMFVICCFSVECEVVSGMWIQAIPKKAHWIQTVSNSNPMSIKKIFLKVRNIKTNSSKPKRWKHVVFAFSAEQHLSAVCTVQLALKTLNVYSGNQIYGQLCKYQQKYGLNLFI